MPCSLLKNGISGFATVKWIRNIVFYSKDGPTYLYLIES